MKEVALHMFVVALLAFGVGLITLNDSPLVRVDTQLAQTSMPMPMAMPMMPSDPCAGLPPSVSCKTNQTQGQPQVDPVCGQASNQQACQESLDLQKKQVSKGVGPSMPGPHGKPVEAPVIMAGKVGPGVCTVIVDGKEIPCNENASDSCPTAQANPTNSCTYDTCPGQCGGDGKTPEQRASEGLADIENRADLESKVEDLRRQLRAGEDVSNADPDLLEIASNREAMQGVGSVFGEDGLTTSDLTPAQQDAIRGFWEQQFPGSEVTLEGGNVVIRTPETDLFGDVLGYRTTSVPVDTVPLNFDQTGAVSAPAVTPAVQSIVDGVRSGQIRFGGGPLSMMMSGMSPVASQPITGGATGPVAPDTGITGTRISPTYSPAPLATRNTVNPTTSTIAPRSGATPGSSPYRSFAPPPSLQNPQSFAQRFAGNGGFIDGLANFVTGGAGQLRNTPQGQAGAFTQPQVVYVVPEFATPASIQRNNRSIQDIASDISATTPQTLARVDHFAQTLEAVGGPSAIDAENKSFGRIQDLIVEDEAIRALRVAEEEGKRAKDSVFCRPNEVAEMCLVRREQKAQEVERQVFVEELKQRVLPETAIQHFLAVYDGWIRPSPAPRVHATSTLGALHQQEQNPLSGYEITTGGDNFVLWFLQSVTDGATAAIDAVINLFTNEENA